MQKNSSTREDSCSTSAMPGANTSRRRSSRMSSSNAMASPNTASGIWGSTTKNPRIPRDTTSFPMEISKTSIAAGYCRPKAARANTNIMTSRTRRPICMECWTPGKARLPQSTPAPRERQRAGPGIRRDNRFACCSAVYGPKHQAEHHAQEQTGHEREVECHIFPLNHDVAGEPSQPDPAQQGPKQAGHQEHEAQHDQKARHRHVSSLVPASVLRALAEQLQQHHEKIYEVEVERERTEHRFLIRDFGRV